MVAKKKKKKKINLSIRRYFFLLNLFYLIARTRTAEVTILQIDQNACFG